jgi:hypothetical protein
MQRASLRRGFVVIAAFFAVAAAFHAAALLRPDLAEPSPPWRHALFVAINAAAAAGVLWRPPGFVIAFALFTAQQLYSHGAYAIDVWRDERRLDWASVIVLVAMPIVLAMLIADARARAMPRGLRGEGPAGR